MNDGDERKQLLVGRGLLTIGDFCRSTGLDEAIVEALVQAGKIEGVFDLDGCVNGLFDDVLPTSEQLHAMGLAVDSDYNPEDLRSHEDDIDDPDEVDNTGSTWTMSWEDGTPK